MIKGFTCSTFDLLHAGHIAMLKEARAQCEFLIVGLQTDPTIDRPGKNKPVQSVYERWKQLEGCKYVDKIIPYDTEDSLYNLLCIEDIDIRILGVEYKHKYFTGNNLDMKFYFNSRNHGYSTSELRERIKDS